MTKTLKRTNSDNHFYFDKSMSNYDDLQPHLKKVAPTPITRTGEQTRSLKHSKVNLSV